MMIKSIVKIFERGNVSVCGLRGSGKDVLIGNVIARRNKPYVSNLDYTNGKNYYPLSFDSLDCGKNDYENFIQGNINYYEYPYPLGADVYISDAGIYLPAQYCNELNKKYKYLPTYFALSRQVSHNNMHTNSQYLGRVWDKVREQSDLYIRCRFCVVLFGKIVIQGITLYDKYESALNRVKPCKITVPVSLSSEAKQSAKQYLDNFQNQHGTIQNKLLIYINKSKHDTYYFGEVLKNGKHKKISS